MLSTVVGPAAATLTGVQESRLGDSGYYLTKESSIPPALHQTRLVAKIVGAGVILSVMGHTMAQDRAPNRVAGHVINAFKSRVHPRSA